MTQNHIDSAVARATGESLATIRRRGFSLADPEQVDHDPEPCALPQTIDWDQPADEVVGPFPARRVRRALAA